MWKNKQEYDVKNLRINTIVYDDKLRKYFIDPL